MKAAQWDNNAQKVVINDVPKPEPGPGQMLVKIKSASLCHSDLMNTGRGGDKPVTLGHEGVGYVEKIHPSAEGKGFNVGDAVGFLYFLGCCYECEGCSVHQLWCETGNSRLQGFSVDGFFAEYAVVDYKGATILPSNLDITRCAPIFCAGITAFHAVDSCELKPGQWLAVIGCGGLGQFATQYAKAMGLKVIAIDIQDGSLEICKNLGADATFNSRTNPNYVEELKKLADGKGAHAAAVFSNAKPAYDSAPSVLRIGGLIMVIGICSQDISVSTMSLTCGIYRIKADSTSLPHRMPKAVKFTAEHNILPEVDFRPLEDVPAMIEEMKQGKLTKRQAVLFD